MNLRDDVLDVFASTPLPSAEMYAFAAEVVDAFVAYACQLFIVNPQQVHALLLRF